MSRILARLSQSPGAEPSTAGLCAVAADVTSMTGAGIMLISATGSQASLCSSNAVSAVIEDLQYTLGEGPCVDAYHHDRPVLEPDLADPHPPRWIAFSPPAVQAGARAVFGFPIKSGQLRLGALNLYRDQPGPLTHDQHADSLVMADVAARAVMAMQAAAEPGTLPPALEDFATLRAVVHQATGMVAAQLEVSVSEALVRMRALAFGTDRSLNDIAKDVVGRQLRFDEK